MEALGVHLNYRWVKCSQIRNSPNQ
jgi:hypothetical protein